MLKTLTEFNAVSGDEDKLRDFLINEIKPYADDIKVDTIGNIIAFKKGKMSDRPLDPARKNDRKAHRYGGFHT